MLIQSSNSLLFKAGLIYFILVKLQSSIPKPDSKKKRNCLKVSLTKWTVILQGFKKSYMYSSCKNVRFKRWKLLI